MEVPVTTINKSTRSPIPDTTNERRARKRRMTPDWSVTIGWLATMTFAALVPQSAEARDGETKYKCQWKTEWACTAAPGGGGTLSNCHTERVWDCVAISGPGSAPKGGLSPGGLGNFPVYPGAPGAGGKSRPIGGVGNFPVYPVSSGSGGKSIPITGNLPAGPVSSGSTGKASPIRVGGNSPGNSPLRAAVKVKAKAQYRWANRLRRR
jgi:hypothetical protein